MRNLSILRELSVIRPVAFVHITALSARHMYVLLSLIHASGKIICCDGKGQQKGPRHLSTMQHAKRTQAWRNMPRMLNITCLVQTNFLHKMCSPNKIISGILLDKFTLYMTADFYMSRQQILHRHVILIAH